MTPRGWRGRQTCGQTPLSQLPLWFPQVGGVLPVASSVWQRGAEKLLGATHLNKEKISFVSPVQVHTCRLYDALATDQAVTMCWCVCCVGFLGLYLRLRGVVCIVSIVVFTWHCSLYAGWVEEVSQLLLLALSQAVYDAAWLLLLLQTQTCSMWSLCGMFTWPFYSCLYSHNMFVWFLLRDWPHGCVWGISWATCVSFAWQPLLQWCTPAVPWPTAPPAGETF